MNFLNLTFIVCALFANTLLAFQLPPPTTNVATRRTSVDKITTTTTTTTTWNGKKTSLLFPSSTTRFMASADVTTTTDNKEEWIQPQWHNKNWVRSLVLLSSLWIAGKTTITSAAASGGRVSRTGAVLHLFSFGTWFGTVFYTTFIAGITMFQNLPRQTFGKLQSKLFPKYFFLSSITIILQLLTAPMIGSGTTTPLLVALLATLLNQIILEPYSTKIMLERYDLENSSGGTNTERYKVLKAQFGKMHGLSSLTNLIAFCGAMIHGYFLSSLLL